MMKIYTVNDLCLELINNNYQIILGILKDDKLEIKNENTKLAEIINYSIQKPTQTHFTNAIFQANPNNTTIIKLNYYETNENKTYTLKIKKIKNPLETILTKTKNYLDTNYNLNNEYVTLQELKENTKKINELYSRIGIVPKEKLIKPTTHLHENI